MSNLQGFDASGLCTGIDYPSQNPRVFPEYTSELYPDRLVFSASGKYAMEVDDGYSSETYLSTETTRFTGSYRFTVHKFDAFGVHSTAALDLGSYGGASVIGIFIGSSDKILFYPGRTVGAGTPTITLAVYDCDTGTFTPFTAVATGITTASGVKCRAVGFSETAFMLAVGDMDHAASGTKIFGAWTATAIGGAFTSRVSANSSGTNQQVTELACVGSANRFVFAYNRYGIGQTAYSRATLTGAYAAVALGTKLVIGSSSQCCIESPHDLTNSHIIVLDTADTIYKLTSDFSSFFDTGLSYDTGLNLARYGNMCYALSEFTSSSSYPNLYYNYNGSTQSIRYQQGAIPEIGGSDRISAAYNHKPEMFIRYAISDNTKLTILTESGRRM